MRIFFGTSAFAKRYIEETDSDLVIQRCDQASILELSELCIAEFFSAMNRLRRDKYLNEKNYNSIKQYFLDDLKDISLYGISTEVIRVSVNLLEKNSLQTLDAIQLACALLAKPDLFVSSDKRQYKAAKTHGLSCKLV